MTHEPDPKDAAWTIAFDAQGNDLALEAELAAMSDDDRARTDQNVRAFMDAVRPTLRVRGSSGDEQRVLAERLLEAVEGDAVLAAIATAPVVPMTEQEGAALAEIEGEPPAWLTTEDVLAAIPERPHP